MFCGVRVNSVGLFFMLFDFICVVCCGVSLMVSVLWCCLVGSFCSVVACLFGFVVWIGGPVREFGCVLRLVGWRIQFGLVVSFVARFCD